MVRLFAYHDLEAQGLVIGVVVLLSRPRFLPDILAMWRVQTLPEAERCLIFVASGDATACALSWPDVLVSEPTTIADLRNIGVARARELGCDALAFWDDDDYYGPRYLEEVAAALEHAPIVGKASTFVRVVDWDKDRPSEPADRLRLCTLPGTEDVTREPCPVRGGTLAFRLDADVPAFRLPDPAQPWGEDTAFCSDAAERGLTMRLTSRWNYAYRRGESDHVWPRSAESHARLYQELGGFVGDCGPWDESVVNGLREPTTTPLELGRYTWRDNPEAVALRAGKSEGVNMKTIVIPTEVLPVNAGGQTVPYTFRSFVTGLVRNDDRFNRSAAGARTGAKLLALFEGDAEKVDVEDTDFEMLLAASESPSKEGYDIRPAGLLVPYLDAIKRAAG